MGWTRGYGFTPNPNDLEEHGLSALSQPCPMALSTAGQEEAQLVRDGPVPNSLPSGQNPPDTL